MHRVPPNRQVHLDFHTSEHVPDIGADFRDDAFAATLGAAKVDSIVLFAKCHHGWSYYDATAGVRHPNLEFDLLRRQVEACHAASIRTVIYLSVGWDERAARANPGWRRILPDGTFHMVLGQNLDPWWSYLCLNTPYRDEVLAQITELAQSFATSDGIWLDIVRPYECCCNFCRRDMLALGLDWRTAGDRQAHAKQVFDRWLADSTTAARSARDDWSVFHNTSLVPRGDRTIYREFSHVEIEAVPTGGWGYDHFPLSARYIDPIFDAYLGVTVRFHLVWGELGGFKHPNALRAEIATMQAHGASVCVGDHLDPRGVLDPDAYRMIGQVYAEAIAREPLVSGSRPVADIGLLSSVAVNEPGKVSRDVEHGREDEGAFRMLAQSQFLFDILDLESDFDSYKLLILPDRIRLSPMLAERLTAYLAQGGSLLMTGESGLDVEGRSFAVDVGGRFEGPSPFDHGYIHPIAHHRPAYVDGPLLMFGPTLRAVVTDGAALGNMIDPLFSRTADHFNGHIATPPQPHASGFASGLRKGKAIWLAQPIFSYFRAMGHSVLRAHVAAVIDDLLGDSKTLTADLPSAATLTLRTRADADIIQIVYAPRGLRGESVLGPIEVIEDLPSLSQISFTMRTERAVASIAFGPAQTPLDFEHEEDRVRFVLPSLTGSEMVVVSYK